MAETSIEITREMADKLMDMELQIQDFDGWRCHVIARVVATVIFTSDHQALRRIEIVRTGDEVFCRCDF